MQKTGRTTDGAIRHARTRRTLSRPMHGAIHSPAESALERRLMLELTRYSRDVPESAFPSFLESLHYDTLN